ncbi:MAG: OmpA family protein, partial [Azonexus sp.]
EGKGEKQPVTGDKCKGNKATKELKACLQPDRRADIEIIGTK